MKTTPCPQPPSTTEPFDGKPRVIVVEEDLNKLQQELNDAHQSVHKWSNKSVELAERVVALESKLKVCSEALEQADRVITDGNRIYPGSYTATDIRKALNQSRPV